MGCPGPGVVSGPAFPDRDRHGVRTLAVCCSGFPALVASAPAGAGSRTGKGLGAGAPVAVVSANRVVSVSVRARAEGVVPGLTRREAQARCPSLHLVPLDTGRDARMFERVMGVLEEVAPRWEVTEPGRCAVPVRGPSRFFGGDLATAERVSDLIAVALEELLGGVGDSGSGAGPPGLGVAVADGPRAAAVLAELAAEETLRRETSRRETSRTNAAVRTGGSGSPVSGSPVSRGPVSRGPVSRGIVVVPPGETAERLSGLPVGALGAGGAGWGDQVALQDLAGVLSRLGLRTLGRFASLEAPDVLARFARTGLSAHDFASGREGAGVALEDLPDELLVSAELDPPAETLDQVGFMARALASEMHTALAERAMLCTRVLVVAETDTGERIERYWRDEGTLSATAVAQRVRWQLEGWLQARGEGSVSRLELLPERLLPDDGRQLDLWSSTSGLPRRTKEGLARLVAMLGSDSVVVPRPGGGRSARDSHVMEGCVIEEGAVAGGGPGGGVLEGGATGGRTRSSEDSPPWPGSIPAPSPAVVLDQPTPVELQDSEGRSVRVDGRGALSAPPSRCGLPGGNWSGVDSWAGPWCVDERWWDPLKHRRRARLQVLLERSAHLLTLESGQWRLEATYD